MIIRYVDFPVEWQTTAQKDQEISQAWEIHESQKLAEIKRKAFMRQYVPTEYKHLYPHLNKRR